jgi:tellurite resistance protein TerC
LEILDAVRLHDLNPPGWLWLTFFAILGLLLLFDLGVLHRSGRQIGATESLLLSSFYVIISLAFGGFLWWYLGSQAGMEFLTAYLVEKSLSLDNIFVIALIFSYFAIPAEYQHRVLIFGILGVIILRGVMIGLGTIIVAQFSWVLYIFAVFLILTGVRMMTSGQKDYEVGNNPVIGWVRRWFRVTSDFAGGRFFVKQYDEESSKTATFATPLFLALAVIETADIVFAVDSIPAVFVITTDPFIVYTSNMFAILGLRALYFALGALLRHFRYLKQALSVVLIFIGSKAFLAPALDIEKVPPLLSLSVTFAILSAGVIASLLWPGRRPPAHAAPDDR